MIKKICFFLSTFCFVGLLPTAPGTWASVLSLPLLYLLMDRPLWLLGVLAGILFVGAAVTGVTAQEMGLTDPSCCVIDEVLGMGVALLWVPREWPYVLMALVLFRIFDIWKPYPIRDLEKLPGGWGIMLDDLLAGIYANIWLQIGAFLARFIAT